MARHSGSVRIGPISILTLIVALCLAVLSVLSIATAQATHAAAGKQADFSACTYQNEEAAQTTVAAIDKALYNYRNGNTGGYESPQAAVEGELKARPINLAGVRSHFELQDSSFMGIFCVDNQRTLNITIVINNDATYRIAEWRTSTEWNQTESDETLWSGKK